MKIQLLTFLFSISFSGIMAQDICLSGDCENGKGMLKCDCGYLFEGTFKNGEKVYGTLTKEELTYTGDFKDDMAHGKGVIEFKDGSKYEGDFAFSQPDGKGKYFLTSGFVYTGEMRGGYFDGWGLKENKETGELLAGFFSKDELASIGILKLKSGHLQIGQFEEGDFTGYGAVIGNEEPIECGLFKKGKLKTACYNSQFKGEDSQFDFKLSELGVEVSIAIENVFYQISLSSADTAFNLNGEQNTLSKIRALNY